jgi:hypothetical protein
MQYTNALSVFPLTPSSAEPMKRRRTDLGLLNWFGCRHRKTSRPITNGKQTSVACLDCGMRRAFDLENWMPYGAFFADGTGAKTSVPLGSEHL